LEVQIYQNVIQIIYILPARLDFKNLLRERGKLQHSDSVSDEVVE